MNTFDVYPRFPIEPVSAHGAVVVDRDGVEYLDLYGGHAVISIGHADPHFVEAIEQQARRLPFYSNSIVNPLGEKLAERLGEISGYPEYSLFLCNSGAEAIENALKLASWRSGGDRIIAFKGAFHGRTSLAAACSDNPSNRAPVNQVHDVTHLLLNDLERLTAEIATGEDFAAVIVEGIQGIGGVIEPSKEFLQGVARVCSAEGIPLILDEIQSGYGRTGEFFAHQSAGIRPDLITVAKGMGNGFPIAGVLISPDYEARHGMLGTTFGGAHVAAAAGIAVLEVIEGKRLMENAAAVGTYLLEKLSAIAGVTALRGRGLMIGVDLDRPASAVRSSLLENHQIFTGSSSRPETLRLLPPLSITIEDAGRFLRSLSMVMEEPHENVHAATEKEG